MEVKYCARCGEKMNENESECPHCSENARMSDSTISSSYPSEHDASEALCPAGGSTKERTFVYQDKVRSDR